MQSDAEQIAEAVSDLYEPDRILARAACRWWDAARPQNWTLEQHLEHPTAYMEWDADKVLAQAVARHIRRAMDDLKRESGGR